MNVLIIGGTRYFGKYLVRRLVEQKYDVTIATRGIQKMNFKRALRGFSLTGMIKVALKRHL